MYSLHNVADQTSFYDSPFQSAMSWRFIITSNHCSELQLTSLKSLPYDKILDMSK